MYGRSRFGSFPIQRIPICPFLRVSRSRERYRRIWLGQTMKVELSWKVSAGLDPARVRLGDFVSQIQTAVSCHFQKKKFLNQRGSVDLGRNQSPAGIPPALSHRGRWRTEAVEDCTDTVSCSSPMRTGGGRSGSRTSKSLDDH
jgi:hypothetical protein